MTGTDYLARYKRAYAARKVATDSDESLAQTNLPVDRSDTTPK
jgi:hypothetical protein